MDLILKKFEILEERTIKSQQNAIKVQGGRRESLTENKNIIPNLMKITVF